MEGTMELKLIRPVGDEITRPGGEFGAHRYYGPHKGVDFKSKWGTTVRASESGKVVFSDELKGSKEKANYGNVIVIDHTLEADPDQRHIYTLYAHLDYRGVYKGQKVRKEETIGRSGNSGTRQSYSGKPKAEQKGYHLHFELIDSPRELHWGPGSFHGTSYRVDPMGGDYIGGTLIIDYGQTAGQMSRTGLSSRYTSFYRL